MGCRQCLPLRASIVHLHVYIAENPISVLGFYTRSGIVNLNADYVPINYNSFNFAFLPDWELASCSLGLKETTEKLREHSIREVFSSEVLKCSSLAGHGK